MKFPPHKASLRLTHNEHLDYFRPVAGAIEDEYHGMDAWVSEDQKAKAVAANDCWVLEWCPNTQNGFHTLAAADLDVLLKAALIYG